MQTIRCLSGICCSMSGKRQQKEAVGAQMLKREEADLDFLENGRIFVEEAEQAAVS